MLVKWQRHNFPSQIGRGQNILARMKPTTAGSPSSRSVQDHQQRLIQARLSGSSLRTGSMITPIVLSRRRPRGSGMNRHELALLLDEALALTANVDVESTSSNKSKDGGVLRDVEKGSDLNK